jgi:hypothetical protein
MGRMSNRDRIARAAEEARLSAEEKAAKKTAKKTTAKKSTAKKTTTRPRARAADARMKVVWVVYNGSGKPVKTYPYPDKAEGEAEARRLSSSTGHPHELRATKVPMD